MQSGDLCWVYGAALSAASDEDCAAEAVRSALSATALEESRRVLMARAVMGALDRSPREPLDALPPDERRAVALARIVGLNVDEIAELTGSDASGVKWLMTSGLQRLCGRLPAAHSAV